MSSLPVIRAARHRYLIPPDSILQDLLAHDWSKCARIQVVDSELESLARDVANGTFDLSWSPMTLSQDRLKYLNYTRAIFNNETVIEVKNFGLTEMSSIFSVEVWISIASLFLMFIVVNSRALTKLISVDHDTHFTSWAFFEHCTTQNTQTVVQPGYTKKKPYPGRSVAFKFIVISTGVLTIHSLSLYSSMLLTQLMAEPVYQPPFNNYEDVVDLVASGRARMNLMHPSYFAAVQLLSPSPSDAPDALAGLRDALTTNPPVFIDVYSDSQRDQWRQMRGSGVPVIVISTLMSAVMQSTLTNCDFIIVPTEALHYRAFAVSPITVNASTFRCLNRGVERHAAAASTVFDNWLLKQKTIHDECRQMMYKLQSKQPGDPIRFKRLLGAFILWFIGLLAATCLCAMEQLG